ncbi:RNA polymerase sigma factor [Larkinella terrae]|uniref:Sigma-70 family RNA polymerase sigma factor n=1 Tax=Larkinella terrae TaxID=2025311 RepID=A0A7K0EU19_9BACT|nr:sigma-70 family RNA polymerase sigma factor [Larkinella terrae]MRS65305.1 sigma-70 family RNA polymerase sigma factor [Larkinella terrae]
MTSQDLKLYKDLCSDDPQLLTAATRQLTRRVKAIAIRIVLGNSGSHSDIDDLVQDTVVAVWQQMRSGAFQVRAETPLDAYLGGVARNKWLKTLHRRTAEALTDLNDSLTEAPGPEHHRLSDMEEALARLGKTCQQVLRLFYWEGYKMEEIARKLGMTMDAAKVRKYRCMLRLGELLESDASDE